MNETTSEKSNGATNGATSEAVHKTITQVPGSKLLTAISLIAIVFGLITLVQGGRTLFTESGRAAMGEIVMPILWYNFIAGFFYIVAGALAFRAISGSRVLAALIAIGNGTALSYLAWYISQGGLYEQRTVIAMSFRTLLWVVLTALLFRVFCTRHRTCHT